MTPLRCCFHKAMAAAGATIYVLGTNGALETFDHQRQVSIPLNQFAPPAVPGGWLTDCTYFVWNNTLIAIGGVDQQVVVKSIYHDQFTNATASNIWQKQQQDAPFAAVLCSFLRDGQTDVFAGGSSAVPTGFGLLPLVPYMPVNDAVVNGTSFVMSEHRIHCTIAPLGVGFYAVGGGFTKTLLNPQFSTLLRYSRNIEFFSPQPVIGGVTHALSVWTLTDNVVDIAGWPQVNFLIVLTVKSNLEVYPLPGQPPVVNPVPLQQVQLPFPCRFLRFLSATHLVAFGTAGVCEFMLNGGAITRGLSSRSANPASLNAGHVLQVFVV